MKKLMSAVFMLTAVGFTHAQQYLTSIETSHFSTGTNSGTPTGIMDIAPHASTEVSINSSCTGLPADNAYVSFYNEEGASTWMTIADLDFSTRRSSELVNATGGMFHVKAVSPAQSQPNRVVFTGVAHNSVTGDDRLVAGFIDVCSPSVTFNQMAFIDVPSSEGIQILPHPTQSNTYIIVGRTTMSGSQDELVVSLYDAANNNFTETRRHRIDFNAHDAVFSLTSSDNIIISGISDHSSSAVNGFCNLDGIEDRSATLIDYDFNLMEIRDMQSYSSFWFKDRLNEVPLAEEHAYFMIEASIATQEYFCTTAIWDRISNDDNEKNYASAVATFDLALNNIDFQQIYLGNNQELKKANLIYVGTGPRGDGLFGISMYNVDNDGAFNDERALISVPMDASNPFNQRKAKRVAQNQGALGVSDFYYGNRAVNQGIDNALFISTGTSGLTMQKSGQNYVHQGHVSLNDRIVGCFERVNIEYVRLCMDELISQLGVDDQGTAYNITVAHSYDDIVVNGTEEFCYSSNQNTFRSAETTTTSFKAQLEFSVSPNPANEYINLTLSKSKKEQESQVRILDLSGRILLEETYTANEMQLDISNLPVGAYIVYVNRNNELFYEKFVKE